MSTNQARNRAIAERRGGNVRSYDKERKVVRIAKDLPGVVGAKLSSERDDARGVDVWVWVDSGHKIPLQVKAGQRARNRGTYQGRGIQVVHVPPGLPRRDLVARIVEAIEIGRSAAQIGDTNEPND